MRNVVNHVAKLETDYTYHFKELNRIGSFFVNKIHGGIQKFIQSCAMGYASKLNIGAIEFVLFLKILKNREISFIRLPVFVKKGLEEAEKRQS